MHTQSSYHKSPLNQVYTECGASDGGCIEDYCTLFDACDDGLATICAESLELTSEVLIRRAG